MQFDNPQTLVRALKGAPISVLVAFIIVRRAMTAQELTQWTGYKGDNITEATKLLVTLGYLSARSARGPWCLCEGVQLPLMSDESDLIGVRSSSSDLFSPVTSYLPQEEDEGDESDLIGVVAALDAAGIREPKRSALKKLPHVTPEFIAAHVEQARREGLPIGTAIHRIEFNWSVDLTIVKRNKNPNGHDRSCHCYECRSAKTLVAMGTHCPDCWKTLNDECRCSESEEE